MKKLLILPILLCLCACDNNTIVGKCLPNERTTTTTEQNGKIIKTSTKDLFLCGCFDRVESDAPQFMISKEEFSFEISNTETSAEIEDSVEYTQRTTTDTITDSTTQQIADKSCDKKCTKLCKKH